MPDHTALPLFDLSDYQAMGLEDSGAWKLRSSAVAPLVAAARGYAWLPQGGSNAYRDFAAKHDLGNLRNGLGRRMKDLADLGGVMMMPLYRTDAVYQSAVQGKVPPRGVVQFRAENPRTGANGRVLKYDFAKGVTPQIDVHPAVPASWFVEPTVVLLSEGTIKIDSALTAICRHWGVPDHELTDTSGDCFERLRDILDDLPMAARHLCVSFAGVGSWHKNTEIEALPLNGNRVWIAFDKDVDINWQVWDQANRLKNHINSRGGTTLLLNLGVTVNKMAGEQFERAGLDDFLAEHGTWDDFDPDRLSAQMPDRPAQETVVRIGDWRINDDEHCAEEYVATTDALGNPTGGRWERQVGIAGRIVKVTNRRTTTLAEERTGRFDGFTHEGSTDVDRIELSWQRPHETEPKFMSFDVPAVTLAKRPEHWDRVASVPSWVAVHPDWPPSMQWLKTLKAHRASEIEWSIAYTNMGWVPTVEDGPLFLVGDMAIGVNGHLEDYETGCGEKALAEASRFGMIPLDDDATRAAASRVIDLLWRSDVFRVPGLAPLVIATALRPIVPLPVRTPVLFTGPRRVGKSWTAAAIMSFWQSRPGTWTENSLPGSVKDTVAASENTMARAAIWVFDDLAPSADRFRAMNEEANLETIIRSAHNGSFKRRMNADMKARTVLRPRALPVITAENELSVSSAMDRCIHLMFRAGTLGSRAATDAYVESRDEHGDAAVVAAGATVWMARQIHRHGYETVVQQFTEARDRTVAEATQRLGARSNTTRHAKMAADIYLGMDLFLCLLDDLGMDEEARWVREQAPDYFTIPRNHYLLQERTTPGAALLEALRSTLMSGSAHITDSTGVGPPNLPAKYQDKKLIWHVLGWSFDTDGEPTNKKSPPIGFFKETKGREYIYFDATTAFTAARRLYRDLIPAGSKEDTSWSSAWDEGIAGGHHKREKTKSSVRVRVGEFHRRGVPIPIELILGDNQDELQ